MCDLICDTIVCCVLRCYTGKINLCDKIMIETQKKMRKYGNQRNFTQKMV